MPTQDAHNVSLRPTLLIGIGGTGCKIIDMVYREVDDAGLLRNQRLRLLGFDTDVSDLSRLDNFSDEDLVQTSTADELYEILSDSDNSEVLDWFPKVEDLQTRHRTMKLTHGAGQMRITSRLAFHTALKWDPRARSKIQRACTELRTTSKSSEYGGDIDVMIVGSLAGGTGSGMFLSIALYIWHEFNAAGATANVRGVFLLPDVFVKAANIPANQREWVYANGYAAMREWNALTLFAQGDWKGPLKFQYGPEPDQRIREDQLPYGNITLIDFHSSRGENFGIGGLESYLKMAANTVFTLMFTPIGGRYNSVAINNVQASMKKLGDPNEVTGSRTLSAVGAYAIEYPVDKIEDYLVTRWCEQILDKKFLYLDQLFEKELAQIRARQKKGETSLKFPDEKRAFVENLRDRHKEDPFFASIHDRVFVERQDGVREPTFKTMLDSAEKILLKRFWNNSDGAIKPLEHSDDYKVDEKLLGGKDAISGKVRERERVLKSLTSSMNELVGVRIRGLTLGYLHMADQESEDEWKEYDLAYHIVRGGPNILQVRYFLYELLAEIKKRMEPLDVTRLHRSIRSHWDKDWYHDTPDIVETPVEGAKKVGDGVLPGWMDGDFKEYAERYVQSHNNVLTNLKKLATQSVKKDLYERLQERIEAYLNTAVLPFFKQLEHTYDGLSRAREKQEDGLLELASSSDSHFYVYSSQRAMQGIWEKLEYKLLHGDDSRGSVDSAITRALHDYFMRKQDNRRSEIEIGSLFKKMVMDRYCRDQLRSDETIKSEYRFSVKEAIEREAKLEGRDPDAYLSEVVATVRQRAVPMLRFKENKAGDGMCFWGLSYGSWSQKFAKDQDLVKEQVSEARLFGTETGEDWTISAEYPDHKWLCVAVRANLAVQDVADFHPGDLEGSVLSDSRGHYFTAYQDVLNHARKKQGGRLAVFPPHVDKQWHEPGKLPSLNEVGKTGVSEQDVRIFVASVALDILRREEIDGEPVLRFYDPLDPARIEVLCNSHDDREALAKLAERSDLGDQISREIREIEGVPRENSPLFVGLNNSTVLRRILALMYWRGDETTVAIVPEAMSAYFGELIDAISHNCVHLSKRQKQRLYLELGEKNLNQTLAEMEASDDAELPSAEVLQEGKELAERIMEAELEAWLG